MQEQADAAITEWQSRITLATDNLLALDDTDTLKRIEGRDGGTPIALVGVTAGQVMPAVAAMRELFDQLGQLNGVIDKAVQLRKSLNRLWKRDETLAQIERLLTGPSITLPETQAPLASRSLLSASENRRSITPDRLLTAMVSAFEDARDAVFAVEAAWDRLSPQLDAARMKVQALQDQCKALAAPPMAELDGAEQRMNGLRSRILTDPLGVNSDLDADLAPLLAAAHERIEAFREERDQGSAALSNAKDRLAEIERRHGDAVAAFNAVQARFGDDPGLQPPAVDDQVRQLRAWLTSMETAMQLTASWAATRVGLDRWNQMADTTDGADRAALARNQALIDLPAELRGRLAVARARAAATGAGAPDAALYRLAMQADTLLSAQQIPLDRVTRLVEACEAKLRCRS
jgi:hypothetical protein